MYYIYILLCHDQFLYTGITTDLSRRLLQHAGKIPGGAKYTRAHPPLRYLAAWQTDSRSNAQSLEYKLKKLSHIQKLQIAKDVICPELISENYKKLSQTALPQPDA